CRFGPSVQRMRYAGDNVTSRCSEPTVRRSVRTLQQMSRQRMNSIEALSPALKPPPPVFEAALEAIELELALGKRDMNVDLCEQIIRETVESVGGILLFQMK